MPVNQGAVRLQYSHQRPCIQFFGRPEVRPSRLQRNVFPQLVGLGRSDTARRFALESLLEARAFLSHPLLGPRLLACTRLVNAVEGRSAHDIFGSPDDMKFHSSMTLFHHAAPKEPAFADALAKYFAGREDELTLNLLKGQGDGRQ